MSEMSEAVAAMDESRSPPPAEPAPATAAQRALFMAQHARQARRESAAAASSSFATLPSQQQQDDLAQRVGRALNLTTRQEQNLQLHLQQQEQQDLAQQQQQQQQRAQSQQEEQKEEEAAMCIICHESDRMLASVSCCGQKVCRSCPPTLARLGLRIRCPACRNESEFLQWFNTNFPNAAAANAQAAVEPQFLEQIERAHAEGFRQQYAASNQRFQTTMNGLNTGIEQLQTSAFDSSAIGQLFEEHTIPLGDRVRREGLLRATAEHNTAVTAVAAAKEAAIVAMRRLRDSVQICAVRAARKSEYEAVLNDTTQQRQQTRAGAYNAAMNHRAVMRARANARFAPY